jgi:putative ABC transport system permease protein
MGIRMALGASAGAVTGLVLNQSLRIVVTGVGVGAALAVGVSRLLASRMVFMRVFDAPAFVVGVMVVVAAALAAGYMPARRAARVDLVETLRCD